MLTAISSSPFTLRSDDAHVWTISFQENKKNMCFFTSLLSKDECNKAERFKFLKDKNYFIICRGFLRCLLGRYLKKPPQEIEIIRGAFGKPYLMGYPLHFNLSHSREYGLCALTRNYELGIDIEYIDNHLISDNAALLALSPQEQLWWKRLDPERKTECFFKIWACKEAFLKSLGKGWLESEQGICFENCHFFMHPKADLFLKNKLGYLYNLDCISGYASALFIREAPLHITHYSWENLHTEEVKKKAA